MSATIFESERLRCRRWVSEDLDPLHSVYSDAEAMRWVGDGQPITRKQCEEWLKVTQANYAQRGYGMFALEMRESGTVVGFAGLVHPGGQLEAEVKYAILRTHWGFGLATEAVPRLLGYSAATHGLQRIVATVASANLSSQRVLAKAGMAQEQRRSNDDGSTTIVFSWHAPGERPGG